MHIQRTCCLLSAKWGKKGKLIISRTIPEVPLSSPTAIQLSVIHAESMVHLRQNSKAVAPKIWELVFPHNSIIYTNYILAHFSTVADFKQLYCINNRGKKKCFRFFENTGKGKAAPDKSHPHQQ